MGLSLRKLFKAREKPGEDVQRVSSVEIADQQVRDAVTEICLRELQQGADIQSGNSVRSAG